MRPLRLELEGFSTFRDRIVVDLDGHDLVAFTGATGAGKSTLIDAMTFALYGSVPRYGRANLVAPVIHQLSTEARVRLDFEVGGVVHLATRIVRRTKAATDGTERASTKEARLEQVVGDRTERTADADDPETTVIASGAREVDEAVEELLGLDFQQFTRTIVLPQGEFAAFLRDDAANRDKLLQRLLDLGIYERMGQLARQEAKQAQQRAEALRGEQDRQPVLDDDGLAELRSRVDRLHSARAELEPAVAERRELDEAMAPLREAVRSMEERRNRLAEIVVPDGVETVEVDLARTVAALAELDERASELRAERATAASALDGLGDRTVVGRLLDAVNDLAQLSADDEDREERLSELDAARRDRTADAESAERRSTEAERLLREATLAADAAGLTARLALGEPCPVCHREVDAIPDHDPDAELAAAEATATEARREATTAAGARNDAEAAHRAAVAAGEQRAEQVSRLADRVDELAALLTGSDAGPDRDPDAAVPTVDELHDLRDRIEAAQAEVHRIDAAVADVDQRAVGARREVEAGRRRSDELRSGLATLRDRVGDLEPPTLDDTTTAAGYERLTAWATERATELDRERAELVDEGRRMRSRHDEVTAAVSDLAAELGLAPDPDRIVMATVEAAAAAAARFDEAERRRAEYADRQVRIDELEADRVLNEAMGQHLRSGGFASWLLAEALDDIVAKATVWLLDLSGGQYSMLARDKSFAIIDHNNANERRDVRTLSGGETFLASLSLALALADSIAELAPVDAPRLESMFLDEGFGTLDPGTLDTVAVAIEELAATGRMIGIVTHVAELAERMPARFEVSKGPSTSTVELIER